MRILGLVLGLGLLAPVPQEAQEKKPGVELKAGTPRVGPPLEEKKVPAPVVVAPAMRAMSPQEEKTALLLLLRWQSAMAAVGKTPEGQALYGREREWENWAREMAPKGCKPFIVPDLMGVMWNCREEGGKEEPRKN